MNRIWNLMLKMVEIDDPVLWDVFWVMETVTAIFAVGATTIISFIVNLIVDVEPYGIELVLGWTVIFLTAEYAMMRLLEVIVNVIEEEEERRYLEG